MSSHRTVNVGIDWLEAIGSALQEHSSQFEPFVPKRPLAASETLQRMTELESLAHASLQPEAPASPPAPAQSPKPIQAKTAPSIPLVQAPPLIVETGKARYAPALKDPALVQALLKRTQVAAASRAAAAAQKAALQARQESSRKALTTPQATGRILGQPAANEPKNTPPRPEDFLYANPPVVQRPTPKRSSVGTQNRRGETAPILATPILATPILATPIIATPILAAPGESDSGDP